ncbi:hypothetical protein OM076_09010 [Solirubrobacter ginsenosidimutans]|uniref:Uncharacterized protein n=1 Tax=Solirubrobacter ginsenosidimutans TaxID=490573 RepID=A0A9X3MV29_9ACTN|nr:hypothetical protein [Solirubrobacter ginsenosidimutans]MDA0160403.1 hypothetical protein [Solirubrobacter ginsenosidimutans]
MDSNEQHNNNATVTFNKRTARIAAIGALVMALLATGLTLTTNHVQAQYKQRDDRYAALAIKTDRDEQAAMLAASRAQDAAVKDAVAVEKKRSARVIKRVVRKMKRSGRRKVNEAYAKGQRDGYSSGNAAGYNAGHSTGRDEGYSEGLEEASDDLSCSDDPDVPLPYCN